MSKRVSGKRTPTTRMRRRDRGQGDSVPGSMPGITQSPVGAQPTRIRATVYGQGRHSEILIDELSKLPNLDNKSVNLWIDVTGLADGQLISDLCEKLGVHPLALEDVLHVHQTPKIDVYQKQLFIISRLISVHDVCVSEQVSLFVGSNVLVSFQERESEFMELIRQRIFAKKGRIHESGADFLAYAILDALIDANYLAADSLAERIETLDEEVTENLTDGTMHSIRLLRHDLLLMRKTIWPMRDVVNQLIRDEYFVIQPETKVFLKDCYDHTIQLIDLVEIYRELCADLRDFYLSAISLRANEIMKILTVISTLFIPLGFIAGVYGMNFDSKSPFNMPELRWQYGYPFVLLLMAATAVGMFYFFRRQKLI